MMYAKEEGVPVDAGRARRARRGRGRRRSCASRPTAGVDIVNDGEMSKPSYATYIKDRLGGFGGEGNTFVYQDLADFPKLAKRVFGDPGPLAPQDAGVQRADRRARSASAAQADVEHLQAALARRRRAGGVPDRRVARRRVAVLPQRALPERGGVPLRDRRRDAPRVRDDRRRPASCCRSTAPTSAWAGTSSTRT